MGTLGHELTHVYLRQRVKADPLFAAQFENWKLHYKGREALTDTEKIAKVGNPDRVTHEAAAEYVDHKIAAYVDARNQLFAIRDAYLSGKIDRQAAQAAMKKTAKNYHDRVSEYPGYEPDGWLGNGTARPTVGMPADMKAFLDKEVLGGQISR